MFRGSYVGILFAILLSLLACSTTTHSSQKTPPSSEESNIKIGSPTPKASQSTLSADVVQTPDPECDYDPILDDMEIEGMEIEDFEWSGPEGAAGLVQGRSVSAHTFNSTTDSNESSTYLSVSIRGDCKVNHYIIPLGVNIEVEWVSINNGLILVNHTLVEPSNDEGTTTNRETRSFVISSDGILESGVLPSPTLNPEINLGWQPTPEDIHLDDSSLYPDWSAIAFNRESDPLQLPSHIRILFDRQVPNRVSNANPIAFIIPIEDYLNNDHPLKAQLEEQVDMIFTLAVDIPDTMPQGDLPSLPLGWTRTDPSRLWVDLTNSLYVSPKNLTGSFISGIRYIGYFGDLSHPISNEDWMYIFQGFSSDGKYLFSFFHPISSAYLSSYLQNIKLSGLDTSSLNAEIQEIVNEPEHILYWQPDIEHLDALVASVRLDGLPENPLIGSVWYWQGGSGTVRAPIRNICPRKTTSGEELGDLGDLITYCELPSELDKAFEISLQFKANGVLEVTSYRSNDEATYSFEKVSLIGNFDLPTFPLLRANRATYNYHDLFTYVVPRCLSGDYRLHPLGRELELVLSDICAEGEATLLFRRSPPFE